MGAVHFNVSGVLCTWMSVYFRLTIFLLLKSSITNILASLESSNQFRAMTKILNYFLFGFIRLFFVFFIIWLRLVTFLGWSLKRRRKTHKIILPIISSVPGVAFLIFLNNFRRVVGEFRWFGFVFLFVLNKYLWL